MSRKKASKIAIMLVTISVFSKMFGFVRDMLIARSFGSGMEADVYFMALTTSTILFAVIGTSLNTTVIPMISEIREKEGAAGEIKYVNNIITIVFLFTLVAASLGYVFAPVIVKVLASGFHGEKFELTVRLTRIGLPIMICNGLLFVMKGYLHVHGNFKIPAFEGIVVSIPLIIYLLFFSSTYGITGFMVVTTSTGLVRIAFLIPSMIKDGYTYKKVFDLKDTYFRNTLVLIGPIILGTLSGYISVIIDRSIASRLLEGSVSALAYAARVRGVVFGLFVVSLTTVLYPMISKYISSKNEKQLIHMLKFGLNVIMLITIPTTVGLMILNYPVTKLLFQRGSFSDAGTLMTSSALFYYALGIVGLGVGDLLRKVYFAMQDTRTPIKISMMAVGINITLNLILSKYMGHNGLALATSVAATFSAIMLLVNLRKRIPHLEVKESFTVFIKSAAASIIMGAVVYILYKHIFNVVDGSFIIRLINLMLISGIGAIVYGILLYLFKVKEIKSGIEIVVKKLRRV